MNNWIYTYAVPVNFFKYKTAYTYKIDIYFLKSSVAGAVSASVEVCNKDLLPKGYFDLAFKYVFYF